MLGRDAVPVMNVTHSGAQRDVLRGCLHWDSKLWFSGAGRRGLGFFCRAIMQRSRRATGPSAALPGLNLSRLRPRSAAKRLCRKMLLPVTTLT